METSNVGYSQVEKVSVISAVKNWLFPVRHLVIDRGEQAEIYDEILTVNSVISLSLVDRVRALVSGKILVTTKVELASPIRQGRAWSVSYPMPPWRKP